MITLFDFPRSSAAYRVRIALNVKGLPYERVVTDLRTGAQRAPEYLAVNPQGLVPALRIDDLTLTQSLAIIEYVDQRFPQAPLIPADSAARAQVMEMALSIACDIHPLNNLRVLNYLRKELTLDEDDVNRWYQHWIATGLAPLEILAAQRRSTYLVGDTLSLADVCLVPQLFNARRFDCDLSPYPHLVRIDAALQQLPAFLQAHPDSLRT